MHENEGGANEEMSIEGGTSLWGMFVFGLLSALALVLMWQIVSTTGGALTTSTVVFTAPSMGPRIVAELSSEVRKELEKGEEDAEEGTARTHATEAPSPARTTPAISVYESFESAEEVLVKALAKLVEALTAQGAQPTKECVSQSIGGPWDSPTWLGDKPGCDDPTPGVTKMFWAPIQGVGGAGGGSSGESSGDSGGGSGDPGGDGPPSGGPGGGPSF